MVDAVRFVQISDTHILRDYGKAKLCFLDSSPHNPPQILRVVLKNIAGKKDKPDFVIFSGDLVHEGDSEDYALFRRIVDETLAGIPAFFALGNHDCKEAYYQGFLREPARPSYYSVELRGLRIIVLDSAMEKNPAGSGFIDETQLAWLRGELGRKNGLGSILVLHHPPCDELKAGILPYCLKNSLALKDILKGSDVRAIFSGHTHENSVSIFAGVPQFTTGSTAFGVSIDEHDMCFTNQYTYNEALINGEGLYVHEEIFSADLKILARVSLADLMKTMEGVNP
ncbi:MAG: metallophosphoesterase [Treponema sp.]|jgi:3',5'-cyclic AMP phosphodiesterase CpdA|nr:metallophosphoesterase [Treponema sp.]